MQDSASELSVVVGKSVLLECALPIERVALGLGGIAEAVAVSPKEVLVNGKAAGETTLILWEKGDNREFFTVVVRPGVTAANDRLDVIRRELKSELPGQDVKVRGENGAIFLSGTVSDLTSSERAVQIASVGGKVVNLLNVQVPAAESQILLKVVFASVDRSKSKELGINLFSTGFGNVIGAVTTGQFSPPTILGDGTANLSNDLNLFAFLPGMNLGGTLKALETKGLVEILAEPNVLAQNGRQGSFLAGGEYPYPVVQGGATGSGPTVTIQFKEYGIRLNFIPTLTPRGTIRLQVAPEVSELNFTNAVTISGFEVPAISVRRVRTEIELDKGQSFAIGGLLDNRETETFQKVPFLSSVPVLGKFFQSIDRTKSNTELIVIVTPQIVQPMPAGAPLPQPPFDQPFLPHSNVPMQNPEPAPETTGHTQAPAVVPVEKLIESMKPEQPLTIDNGYGATSGGSFGGGGGSAPSAPQ